MSLPTYKSPLVSRALTIALSLAAILSVSTVLVTPSLADDVDGISHQQYSRVLNLIWLRQPQNFTLLQRMAVHRVPQPTLDAWFDLLCSRLC